VAITPASLRDYARIFKATYGDGTATTFTITHNLNNQYPIVQITDIPTGTVREPVIDPVNANQVIISGYTTAPGSNSQQLTVYG
jgi:hypothetical protein